MTLDSNEIMAVLPHRFPFLLVDRITECEPGIRAVGRKCVTVNEPFFCGHFPQHHVMPGVLTIEALAQVGAVAILTEEANKGKIALFGGIKNARFKREVKPGDVMELECIITARRGPIGMGRAEARINGELAAAAELTFAIT
ncbi:MAG: 3-hydroxyacyl-ACP dehydratase FabZ [Candidatus Pelethousia sp.]|nr:3-hydroxyacyl-ACP dehydratase FabZ [Candidatus Pelethousia sp.]